MTSRIVVAVSLVLSLVVATGPSPLIAAPRQATPDPTALDLVRTTVAHEVSAANDNSVKHFFRARKNTPQGSQTRLYVETSDAMAGMTVAYNDKPLTAQQVQGEESRLDGLVGNPEQLRRKQHQEKEEATRTLCIVKALPEAFLYEYDGDETGTAALAAEGMHLARLKFRSNPAYRPPSHVEEVLVGMQGTLLIDPIAHRIARIDGTLFKEVNFGWGILGHLNKGGHFLVEQRELDDGSWDVSRMSLEFTGKILLFKNIAIKSDEFFTDFRRVPPGTTFAQGVAMLRMEQAKLTNGGTAETATAEAKSSH